MPSFRAFRDAVTFLFGLVLAGYEVLSTPDGSEPSLVVLGLAVTMMGLPGTLGIDRLINKDAAPAEPNDPGEAPSNRRHAR